MVPSPWQFDSAGLVTIAWSWLQVAKGLSVRTVLANLDGIFPLGINRRPKSVAGRPDRVEDLPVLLVDHLDDRGSGATNHQFRQPADRGAAVVVLHPDRDRPARVLHLVTILDITKSGPAFESDCPLALVKTDNPVPVTPLLFIHAVFRLSLIHI